MICKQGCHSLLLISSRPETFSLRHPPFQSPRQRKQHLCICRSSSEASVTGSSGGQQLRITTKKVLKQLSSLNLAIGELAAIAGLSVIGTVIKQNEAAEFYVQNYPGRASQVQYSQLSFSPCIVLTFSSIVLCVQKAAPYPSGSSGSCNGITFTQPITFWPS